MSLPDPSTPEPLEFDLGLPTPERRPTLPPTFPSANARPPAPDLRPPGFLDRMKARGGILGSLASLLILGLKFAGTIKLVLLFALKGKFLLTAGSMLLSIWLQSRIFGWPYAVGIVLMIFLHECGHAVAARRLGYPYSGMIFIPFMGAVVFHKRGGDNVVQDAFVGIAGPIAGTLVGLIYLALYKVTGMPIFAGLASLTFLINLFNLIPTPPLDGGWITPVFSPKLLALGMVLLLFVAFRNPFVILLAVLSLPRVIAGWKASPADSSYFRVTPRDRLIYGCLYIGLAATLALLHGATQGIMDSMHVRPII